MTSQVLETRDGRRDSPPPPAELPAFDRTGGSADPTAVHAAQEANLPLFAPNDTQDFRSRWEKIQSGFVDEPRQAFEQADELVASAIKRLDEVFAGERQKREADWEKTGSVSTEGLRIALRRYRSFLDRLLSV